MKRFLFGITIVILVLSVFIAKELVLAPEASAAGKRVIVVFDPDSSSVERRAIVLQHRCSIVRELFIVSAIVIHLPEQASEKAREAILEHAPVIEIVDDLIVEAFPKPDKPGGKPPKEEPPPQSVPWGIDRIDADLAWPNSTGQGIKVAILDTGIDVDHPDLEPNPLDGVNIINPKKHYDDDNGHGTHVAGIVAAVDNTIGVIGVANQASLFGVKVLDRRGNGWMSDVIAGLEWCMNNYDGMDVINMSLGTSSDSSIFHDVIIAVDDAGIVIVAAAGNNGSSVSYPAAYPETIAVSATDSEDSVATWSNYGPEIDLAAPGVEINSTYKGGEYKVLQGTSMAAPHVTGTVALILENKPDYAPDDVLTTLTSTAEDLGLPGSKQGSGIVDAEKAVLVTE